MGFGKKFMSAAGRGIRTIQREANGVAKLEDYTHSRRVQPLGGPFSLFPKQGVTIDAVVKKVAEQTGIKQSAITDVEHIHPLGYIVNRDGDVSNDTKLSLLEEQLGNRTMTPKFFDALSRSVIAKDHQYALVVYGDAAQRLKEDATPAELLAAKVYFIANATTPQSGWKRAESTNTLAVNKAVRPGDIQSAALDITFKPRVLEDCGRVLPTMPEAHAYQLRAEGHLLNAVIFTVDDLNQTGAAKYQGMHITGLPEHSVEGLKQFDKSITVPTTPKKLID
jgi:hypothetical protein